MGVAANVNNAALRAVLLPPSGESSHDFDDGMLQVRLQNKTTEYVEVALLRDVSGVRAAASLEDAVVVTMSWVGTTQIGKTAATLRDRHSCKQQGVDHECG